MKITLGKYKVALSTSPKTIPEIEISIFIDLWHIK
jgi:hypothetical protein